MSTIDEEISKSMERIKQLTHQKKAQEAREKEKQKSIDKERQRIIGKIVAEYFPEVLRFQPRRTHTDNQTEFAPLANFLSVLAADKELVACLKNSALAKMALED